MRWALGLCLILLTAPTAGCLTSDDNPNNATDPTPSNTPNTTTDTIQAPTWNPGDYWTYENDELGEITLVVSNQTPDDWIIDTTHRDLAFFAAQSNVSFLGERRKTDLAGSQADTRVEFFQFPLEENKTWTTTWDQAEHEITVDKIDDGTAHLTARENGQPAVRYTYNEDAQHFDTLAFLDDNGTETFTLERTQHGANFTGTALRWSLDEIIDRTEAFDTQPVSWGGGFNIPEDTTDLWLQLTVACPSGAFDFGLGGQQANYNYGGPCPYSTDQETILVEDPEPDNWNYGLTATSPEATGYYTVTLYLRTLTEIPIGNT